MSYDLTSRDDLFDVLDGLFAYYTGCVDSGIHDELLKEKLREHLRTQFDGNERRHLFAQYIVDYFLDEDALDRGYGPEDVKNFLNWLERESLPYF